MPFEKIPVWFLGLAGCPEKHRRVCYGGAGCYSPSRVCDGEWNCREDKEDERDCPDSCIRRKHRGAFLMRDIVQCRDLKGCVKISKVCDGNMDCSDGSDEVNCDEFCSLHGSIGDMAFWKCRGVPGCIKGEFLCDGISDCEDGSDEDNCDALCESIGYWPCRSALPPFAKCISRQERCDGYVDCRDFSDEIGCGYCGEYGIAVIDMFGYNHETEERTYRMPFRQTGCIPIDDVCNGDVDITIYGIHDETDCTQVVINTSNLH
ncbi:uncharacterized protein LOC144866409 [Branchiostoma floridae x Branchiostoma japonicum]